MRKSLNSIYIQTGWCHSSVGRAKDWKSLCHWFDSRWHHKSSSWINFRLLFFVYGKDCQSSRKTEVGFFDVLPMNYNSSRRLIRVQAVEKYGESPIGMRIRNHLFPFLCRRKKQKRLSQITNNKVLIPYELLLHENFVLRNFATAIPRECCILRNIF